MKKFKKTLSVLLVFSLLISGLTLTAATPASAETKAARLYADAKVASGWYVLRPGCTSTRALTINGQSTSNGATAILYTWLKSPQYFYIKGMGDGTYTIRNYKSGKYLEVKGSSTSSGATVQQWTENGRLQQRWYISKSGTRYVIQSSLSKNVLSVLNAQNANGAKVFTHSRSTSPAQLWELIKVGGSSATPTPKPTATPTPKPKATATPTPKPSSGETKAARLYADAKVASGWYVFRPGCTTTRAMTISGQSKSNGAQGVLYTWLKSPQYFYIKNMGDGTYTIRNYTSDKYMEVKGSSKTSGAIVQQWTENGKLQQRWYIGKVGDRYVIQNTLSKNVLSVTGSKNANNAGIIVLTRSDSNASQKWELLKVTAAKATPTPTPKATATPTPKLQATPTPSLSSSLTGAKNTGMNAARYAVLVNIIGAVETGGQVYGNRNYADYTEPYTNSSLEHTITIGWAAYYGSEAQKLISNILKKDPTTFRRIDQANSQTKIIESKLSTNWVTARWKPNATEKAIIKQLIVTDAGKACQDEMFTALMQTFVADCQNTYTNNTWAIMMYCQIRHLGGLGGVNRIFKRCNGDYSLEKITEALRMDQDDTSSSNQVGDKVFWSRHMKCIEFIKKYAIT